MEKKIYKNYINGEWVESASGCTFEDRNPADNREVIGEFQRSNPEDVKRAVEAAKNAYDKWRLYPAPKRAEILFKVAEILVKRKEEFAREMTQEMGKVLKETRGDVQEAIDMSYYMAGEGRRQFGQTTPSELPNKFAMSVRMPMGACALITPWNFPMAIPSWKLMPALICGNTVVFKPATDTPLSAYNLIKSCEEAGIPKGVVNFVTGGGSEVGGPLMKNEDVKLVSFTGSTAVGKTVSEACAPAFKHTNLEMGGKNAIMVMEDANLDLAVEGAIWGGFGTTGQRCTAASRVIVHKKVYQEFAEKFVARAKALKIGNGLDPKVEMGPSINENQLQTVMNYVEIGKKEGAKLISGGNRLVKGDYIHGFFHEPTVFADVDPKMRIAQEEIFGPVVALIPCDNLQNAINICNGVVYGLSASIYTQDVNKAFVAMRDIYTGIFYVNSSTIGAEVHLPFGGTKQTGNGHREAGTAALDVFSEWKTVYIDYSGKLQKAQIDDLNIS
ncbi:MAG: Aldehyde dehydrogenase [candidate division Zixibacteria bacterium RBG-1]|nr:MAG: Aldehyde dehydrogenase [candidate division Zixibacteria bacterium RBG-1]OGC83458.1 MAG: aldehyde dehydrogenase [candidate division Zixibacteria bacterium RBG_19FT_COMBO_42_43]